MSAQKHEFFINAKLRFGNGFIRVLMGTPYYAEPKDSSGELPVTRAGFAKFITGRGYPLNASAYTKGQLMLNA